MGIHDRDYIRQAGHGAGGSRAGGGGGVVAAMRMWSVTTWLIVICIAVFVIDGFLPARDVNVGAPMLAPGVQSKQASIVVGAIDQDARVPVREPDGTVALWQTPARPLIDSTTNQVVGWQPVRKMQLLQSWLHFSTYEFVFRLGFWRLIGFQFLHGHLPHLLFNMLGLFFFGPLVERYLGSKRYLAFYLLCGICGALMYMLLNLAGFVASLYFGSEARIPGLLFNDMGTPLIGASAGVFGVIVAGAFLAPTARVLFFFVLPMSLRTLAFVLVGMALYALIFGRDNAGGEAGHLGGAIAGFYFIRHPRHLHDFFDVLGRIDPTSHHYRGHGAQTGAKVAPKPSSPRGSARRAEIDRILDKVHAQGLGSLTHREKRILREASDRGR